MIQEVKCINCGSDNLNKRGKRTNKTREYPFSKEDSQEINLTKN